MSPSKPGRNPTPTNTYQLPFNFAGVAQQSFDKAAFANLLKDQGVRFRHLRAIPDPTLLADRGDNRRLGPNSDSDGFLYRQVGCFFGSMQANTKDVEYAVEGNIDQSQAYLTPDMFYEDGKTAVILNPWDRLELEDIELRVTTSQLISTSGLKTDRAQFPIICVEHLIGSDGFDYQEGTHFKVTPQGEIEWTSQTRPSYNPNTGQGDVYAIRFTYKPYWVIRRLLHEIRVAQITDPMTGQRYIERLPYQCVIARESVFKDKAQTGLAPLEDPRYSDLPDGTTYGPRGGTQSGGGDSV